MIEQQEDYSDHVFEHQYCERYLEVLHISAQMLKMADQEPDEFLEQNPIVEEAVKILAVTPPVLLECKYSPEQRQELFELGAKLTTLATKSNLTEYIVHELKSALYPSVRATKFVPLDEIKFQFTGIADAAFKEALEIHNQAIEEGRQLAINQVLNCLSFA